MRIIIATGNEGKMREFRSLLKDFQVPIYSLKDLNLHPEIIEDGKTLDENAAIKAKSLGVLPDTIVLGDDSGFFIDAMNGEPGIYSARYLESFPSRESAFQTILSRLADCSGRERACHFETHIAMLFPDGRLETVKGELHGEVSTKISGSEGFGYDPIFYYPPLKMTTADMSMEGKNSISHRSRALLEAKKVMEKFFRESKENRPQMVREE